MRSTRVRGLVLAFSCPLLTAVLNSQESWVQRQPTTSPPARAGHCAAYDPLQNRHVVFGGSTAQGLSGETWTWRTLQGQWQLLQPTVAPSARSGAAMVYDESRGVLVLFGGLDAQGELADTWELAGSAWRLRSPANSPPARTQHALAYDSHRGRVVLYGGHAGTQRLADLWEWDGRDWSLRQGGLVGNAEHAAAFDSRRGHTVFFGGAPTFGGADQTYEWDGSVFAAAAIASRPPARRGACATFGHLWGRTVLFGGTQAAPFDDTWQYDGSAWRQVVTPNRPPARSAATLTFDRNFAVAVLFGGLGGAGPLQDVWELSLGSFAPRSIAEVFSNDLQLDKSVSSGTWSGGQALPGLIGGDGRHGEFDVTDGVPRGNGVYEWSTDSQRIPGRRTFSGRDEIVTDGTFQFSRFHLPPGTKMRIVGSRPLRLFARGRFDVEGTIDSSAPDMGEHGGGPAGQPGGPSGAGGGSGGGGARQGSGTGAGFDGAHGMNVGLVAGHAYANRALNTGGRGSAQFPLDGLNQSVTWGYLDFFSTQIAAGGGGGGGATSAGQDGRAVSTYNNRLVDLGPNAAAGIHFDPFPLLPPLSSLDHCLIGGAGAGGGGSHPYFSIKPVTFIWRSGAGGAGGGGAIGVRAGSDLTMTSAGRIEVRGGSGFASQNATHYPTPGGAGAGGSVVLQAGGLVNLNGLLDARGGTGGSLKLLVYNLDTRGGDGGDGYLRLETPLNAPPVSALGQAQPPAAARNVGLLLDRDAVVGAQSKWYATRFFSPPFFLRYEVDATVNAGPVRYSDDIRVGPLADVGQAVRFLVQGARVDPTTGQPDPLTIRPWRRHVGEFATERLNGDDATGFRFLLLFDRAVAATIAVRRVEIYFGAAPSSFLVYGSGCVGTAGVPQLSAPAGQLPILGRPFTVQVAGLPLGQPAALQVGASRTHWDTLPLPLDLSPIGMPGCFLLASPQVAFVLLPSGGVARHVLLLPQDPVLIGGTFFLQAFARDPAANALGFTVSNGGECRVGN